jgi:hypothetical protein
VRVSMGPDRGDRCGDLLMGSTERARVRAIRERMAWTGENYTVAARAVDAGRARMLSDDFADLGPNPDGPAEYVEGQPE